MYKFYVTDMLQGYFTNKYYVSSFKDMLYPKDVDTRSGEEIANDIINRAGLIVK